MGVFVRMIVSVTVLMRMVMAVIMMVVMMFVRVIVGVMHMGVPGASQTFEKHPAADRDNGHSRDRS